MTNSAVDSTLREYHRAGPAPAPADLAAIRQQVLTRTAEPARRPLRRRVTVVVAASVVATAAGTAIILWPEGTQTPVAGPTATSNETDAITKADSAIATMDLVVRRVANAQPLDLSKGGYLYTTERSVNVESVGGPDGGVAYYVAENLIERWSALDEGTLPKLMRMTSGLNAHPLTPADGEKLARYGRDYTKVTTSTMEPGTGPKQAPGTPSAPSLTNPTPAFLAALPTDPAQLLAVLRSSAGEDAFKQGTSLATTVDALLSPELRSALYRALAMMPGVERIPGQADLAGRPGVAIAHSADGKRTELVIDPTSSRTIGFRMVTLTTADGLPAGTTVIYSTTSNQKIVEHVGDK